MKPEILAQAIKLAEQAQEQQLSEQYEAAEESYLQALTCLKAERLGKTELFAKISANLGSLYYSQRRYSDARRRVKAALTVQDNSEAQYWLAECYFKERRYKSADKTYTALLERQDLGVEQLARLLHSAGFFYYYVGEFNRSEPLLHRCLELTPPESLAAALLWQRLGLLYQFVDESPSERVRECYEKMLAHQSEWGPSHPLELAGGLARLATWFDQNGEQERADSFFGKMAAILENVQSGPETNWMESHYADFLERCGRAEEAALLRALQPSLFSMMQSGTVPVAGVHESVVSDEAVRWHLSQGSFAEFEGNVPEAQRLYNLALEKHEKLHGPSDLGLCEILCRQARISQEDGQQLVHRALEICRTSNELRDERATTLETAARYLLDGIECSVERFREALITKEQLHGEKSSEALECRWRLGQFLLHHQRSEEAWKTLHLLAERSSKNRKIHSLERADFLNTYACALEEMGRSEESAAVVAEVTRITKRYT
ncbi:MAG: tetratricopeptide repeat protein [Candidatus Eremiobacteraeota bacterium]|nr:tetratricopeptide repeat protein [Candidatus Eremiobacteraeota bacterium]